MAEPATIDEVHRRYKQERDKRLRADGNDQYIAAEGVFSHYVDDPYVPRQARDPIVDSPDTAVDVAFIGGGFAGLLTGAALRQAGIGRVRLIDKGGDVGGTWYWNRYPGAMCDTASLIYLPLLEETGHLPTEKYTRGPEILEHCRRIARHFDLYDDAVFSTEVTGLTWDAEHRQWVISTDRGDAMRARHVCVGTGPLHKAKLPGIPGIGDFTGHSFHTSRWDYDYTGGDPEGSPMTGLADRRVGIIGTGATAVQCIPHLARSAGELFVFQRTPSSIDVRANRALDYDELTPKMGPGWQRRWLENFTILQTGGIAEEDLVMDGWTDISQRIRDRVLANPERGFGPQAMLAAYHESDDEKMAEIRARVDSIVDDPTTAEALKPWYRQLCKRPCFHDEYLDSYNRPNVHLIDTDGRGVERITEGGLMVNGTEFELDCIIYASGFEVGTDFEKRWGFDPAGTGGQLLSETWAEGMSTLHGMHVNGFPNLFVIGPSQAANLISNIPHNLVEAGRTVAAIVAEAERRGAGTVEVTEEAERAWVELLESGGRTFGGDPSCTPGYYNNEGRPIEGADRRGMLGYPDGPTEYFRYIETWRESGEFAGLVFD